MVSDECLGVKEWVCQSRCPSGVSGLSVGNATSSEELANLIDHRLRVTNMVGRSLASRATFSFQGPSEADFGATMLGDGDFMSLHEAGDGSVARVAEAFEESAINISVEGGHGSSSFATSLRAFTFRASFGWSTSAGRGSRDHKVPRVWQRAEAFSTVGDDQVLDATEGRDGRSFIIGELDRVLHVVLLGFIEDTTDQVHAHRSGASVLSKAVQCWADVKHKGANSNSNWVVNSMKDVDDDRPTVELLSRDMGVGREADISGGYGLSIGKREGRSAFSNLSVLSRLLDNIHLRVPLADNGKGGEALPKDDPSRGGLIGAKDILHELGGGKRGAGIGERHSRGRGTRLESSREYTILSTFRGRDSEEDMDRG